MNEEMKNQTEQLPLLKVHMMGSFFLEYGDQPISFRKTMATKSMRLLQIFLYNKDNGISRGRLLESTYGREDVADAANSLRVGVHRLKRSLVEAGLPQFEYIYTQKGVYHWTSPMPVEVDAIDIKNKILEAGKEDRRESAHGSDDRSTGAVHRRVPCRFRRGRSGYRRSARS